MKQNRITHHFHSFRAAAQFLTCLPAGAVGSVPKGARLDMMYWYPAVGAVIGVVLIGFELLSTPLNDFMQASLLVTLWVVVTGGLHLDGLADCADAWVGGLGSREKTLEIMKDPRCGPFAAVAVTLALILKVAALTAYQGWLALLLAPYFARLLIIPAILSLPYAREDGLAGEIQSALSHRKRKFAMGIIVAGALAPLPFASPLLWLALAATSAAVFLLWRVSMIRRLQGFTGDCIGLLVELSELALLFVFVVFEIAAWSLVWS